MMVVLLYRLSNCSQLMVPLARIERATSPLPRECSTTELQRRNPLRGRLTRDQHAGAGEGNRTLVVSLEGFCSTIELHPRFSRPNPFATQRTPPTRAAKNLVEGAGFEPT